MKNMCNRFCIFVKEPNKKSAHFRIGWFEAQDDAEQEANNIYTGEQEVTIRQYWVNEKGYTGTDIVFTYPIIKEATL